MPGQINFEQIKEYGLKIGNLSQDMQLVATAVGIDGAIKLILAFGGSSIYFPKKESLLKKTRNRTIKNDFNGTNLKELSMKYRLSTPCLRAIIRRK